jgi:soluble lytic murein transglycosylase-like protein
MPQSSNTGGIGLPREGVTLTTMTTQRIITIPGWFGWCNLMTIAIGIYALALSWDTAPRLSIGLRLDPAIKIDLPDYGDESAADKSAPLTPPRATVKRKTRSAHKKIGMYHRIISDAGIQYSIDPALIKAIIHTESSFNPAAVSRTGAMGLMQLMPSTAREMGVEDCFDPQHNINGGTRYLKRLLRLFDNDRELALAAYNAGIGNVREYGGVPPFQETRRYVKKVGAFYRYYKMRAAAGLDRT